ncbi:MAG: hypothetical protein ACLQIB_25740 [Isosphaeraceae bacterium]
MPPGKSESSTLGPGLEAPTPQQEEDPVLQQKFRRLVAEWETDVAPLSSITVRARHRAYLEIIALGPAVVPLLLRELEQRPNHWFAALRSITGEDPVPPSERGRIGAMAEAWIAWGKQRGYL